MAFQFQSIAALSPLIIEDYGLGLADIGLLIGLYLAPGVVVALPGGAIAARFGDKRIVSLSMGLMLVGAAVISFSPGWGSLLAGRLLAGIGGVALNVVMTKMLVDWFVGREISTALAIFVNSWPVGIALALLILPAVAVSGGLAMAWAVVLLAIVVGLVLFVAFYRTPENAAALATTIKVARFPAVALAMAALVWAGYNAALSMVFSFGPAFLAQIGWTLEAASSVTSLFMVVFSLSLPLGGILADRTGRRDTIITISLLGFAILMPLTLVVSAWSVGTIFVVVGIVFGLAAGPIMTLPSVVLMPEARSFGMGVSYTFHYAIGMAAPMLVGAVAERSGNAGAAFVMGALMLVLALIALAVFRRVSAGQ